MKNYTISGSTGSRDIVHMRANKDAYDITSEQPNELTYTSKMGDRQYVLSTSIETLKFKHVDSEGVNKFGWDTAYEMFASKRTCKEFKDSGYNNSGVYTIKPVDVEYQVYCDMTTDGGGWTRIFYQNYNNSVDTTSVNLLSATERTYAFNRDVYEEVPNLGFTTSELLVNINTGTNTYIKINSTTAMRNLFENGVKPQTTLQAYNSGLNQTVSGTNLTTGQSFSNVTMQFYNSGAIVGEWDGTYEMFAGQWWCSNDSTNVNSRFMVNSIAGNSSSHYSSLYIR